MKKDKQTPLFKARSLFNAKKFQHVIHLLEPEIYNYRESFMFYYLLGLAYLYNNEANSGESYLKRAHQIDEANLVILEGLAYVCFKKDQYDEALKLYLEILDLEPKNGRAKKGLNIIRKVINLEGKAGYINSTVLLPDLRLPANPWKIFLPLLLISLLAVLIYLIVNLFPIGQNEKTRPGLEAYIFPQEKPSLNDFTQTYRFSLSDKEIETSFNKAKQLFNQYRDNLALVEVNRLLNSNASQTIKSLVFIIKEHVTKPDFSTIKDSFSLIQVQAEPLLYTGCYVQWAGKVGGLIVSEKKITFDLWIGDDYHFEGVIPVEIAFAALINNGDEFEVLGEVIINENEEIALKGVTLHKVIVKEKTDSLKQ